MFMYDEIERLPTYILFTMCTNEFMAMLIILFMRLPPQKTTGHYARMTVATAVSIPASLANLRAG